MTQPSTADEQQDRTKPTLSFSKREIQILSLVAEGRTDNEIGILLCMSAKTVSWYVREVRLRLGARSRAHAVALAMRQGILSGCLSQEQGP